MALKHKRSFPAVLGQALTSFVRTVLEWIVILLFYATLPITRHLFSRPPEPPVLKVRDVRWDRVRVRIVPQLTSRFNVERYSVQWRPVAPQPADWVSAGEGKRGGDEVEVSGLAGVERCELRARAANDRGASAWPELLLVRLRRRAVNGGCDAGTYTWSQSASDVVLQIAVPKAVAGRDVRVGLSEGRNLDIEVCGGTESKEGAVRVAGCLRHPAKGFGNGSVWELVREGGGKVVIVTLEKQAGSQWWTSVLKGEPQIDLHTIPGYDPPPFDSSVFSI